MCGICGVVDLSSRTPDRGAVIRLRESLRHRGPDDSGLFASSEAVLGSRRLAVIDLSEDARMPMTNEDRSLWITYNGEIYNHRDLREELAKRGHVFRSRSDTEVIVHAYEEWNMGCVERFVGMFAFAIWDSSTHRLFAARDRLGVKPFFYTVKPSRIAFASEVHGLYEFESVSTSEIDPLALDAYLAFGYAPPDRGFVRGVSKLPPGHTLVFDSGGLRAERYWRPSFRPTRRASMAETLDELDVVLGEAVGCRLEADVPLGCFLSGGIDSGLVTAMAARKVKEPLETFCVGFSDATPKEDERALAQSVASRYQTRHHELMVKPEQRSLLTSVTFHTGEPFADISILPTYEIARRAREHVTVVLSGDGGDESFAGYRGVWASHLGETAYRYAPRVGATLARAVARSESVARWTPVLARTGRWAERYVFGSVAKQFDYVNHWDSSLRPTLYGDAFRQGLQGEGALGRIASLCGESPDLSNAERQLLVDLQWALPGCYLTKVDIASGMASLEVRSPFLDHRVVEFAASLPIRYKLTRFRQKGLLRRLATRYLPREITQQPKRGFAPKIGRWLRTGWVEPLRRLATSSALVRVGVIDGRVLQATIDAHTRGTRDHGQRLWSILCLEAWWRLFVERSLRPGDEL